MNIPLIINFAYDPRITAATGTCSLPKIYQGAPYNQAFKVLVGDVYRDWLGYDEIRMQVRLAQDEDPLFTLSKTAGTIVATIDTFTITFPASTTEDLDLPVSALKLQNEVPFVHDIELMQGGVVVERLAQGVGRIVVNTTR